MHLKASATSRHCSYVYDTTITRHRHYDMYNTTWTAQSRFLGKVTKKILWNFEDLIGSTNIYCYMETKHILIRFTNQKNTSTERSKRFSHATPRTQNQAYITAGPHSGPVTIKVTTTSITQRWCIIVTSNTNAKTKDTGNRKEFVS